MFGAGGECGFLPLSFKTDRINSFMLVLYFSYYFRDLCACYRGCSKLVNLHITSSEKWRVEM